MNKQEYNSFELQARVKNKKVQKSQYLPTRQCLDNISFHPLHWCKHLETLIHCEFQQSVLYERQVIIFLKKVFVNPESTSVCTFIFPKK